MNRVILTSCLIILLSLIGGCGTTDSGENNPPRPPSNPNPAIGATNVPNHVTLSWSCSDPENDLLTFDILLGTESLPALVKADHTEEVYTLPALQINTNYYWQIVAKDNAGNKTTGDMWNFTTTKIAPEVDSIFPPSPECWFWPGDTITIFGQNFGSMIEDNIVKIFDSIAIILSANSNQLIVIVPQIGSRAGLYGIRVITEAGTWPYGIIVQPPQEFRGQYDGTYKLIWYATYPPDTDWQYIEWIFTDYKFFCMAADTITKPRIICDFSGNYVTTGIITFKDTLVATGDCNHEGIAIGEFTYDYLKGEACYDTLMLYQNDSSKELETFIRIIRRLE